MVIAIIAILAAMLFPAVGKSLERAEVAKCRSNLKQLAAMAMVYASDHGGELVMPHTGRPPASRGENWSSGLVAYMGGSVSNAIQNVMHCPTQFKLMKKLPMNQWRT